MGLPNTLIFPIKYYNNTTPNAQMSDLYESYSKPKTVSNGMYPSVPYFLVPMTFYIYSIYSIKCYFSSMLLFECYKVHLLKLMCILMLFSNYCKYCKYG